MIKKLAVRISLLTFMYTAQAIPNPAFIKRKQLKNTTEKILQFRLCPCSKKSDVQIQEFLKEVDAWKNAFEESKPFLAESDVKTLAQALSSHATNPYSLETKAQFKQAHKDLSENLKQLKKEAKRTSKEHLTGNVSAIHQKLLEEYALPVLKAFEHLKPLITS